MPSEATRADETFFDVSEAEVEQNIALCMGDLRETIRQLLIGQAYLENQISSLKCASSKGYGRSRPLPFVTMKDVQEKADVATIA